MIDLSSITTGLEPGDDGIWHCGESRNVPYPQDGNKACFDIEDRSFWFKHRNRCILSAIKLYPPGDGEPIFDIGGGNGFVSLALAHAGFDVVMIDAGPTGAMNAKRRGVENVVCGNIESIQFKPNSLSAVGLFDVIEHIEDDMALLQTLKHLMKQHARLYITVPAYAFLWSSEDVSAGHFRR